MEVYRMKGMLPVIIILVVFCSPLTGFTASISPSGNYVTVPSTNQTADQGCAGQYANLMQVYDGFIMELQSKVEELKAIQEDINDLQQQIKYEQEMVNYYKNNPVAAKANPGKYEQHLMNLQTLQSKHNNAVPRYNKVQSDRARTVEMLNQLDNQIRAVIAKCEAEGVKVGPPPKAVLSTGTTVQPISPRRPAQRFQQRTRPGGSKVLGTPTPAQGVSND